MYNELSLHTSSCGEWAQYGGEGNMHIKKTVQDVLYMKSRDSSAMGAYCL